MKDILREWAEEQNMHLFSDHQNKDIKFFYVSRQDESLQIVLEDLLANYRVDVWDVETHDDEPLHKIYWFEKSSIKSQLNELVGRLSDWMDNRTPLP